MTPLPAFWAGFHCGGLVRCPVCCGVLDVVGFVLGVVVRVGYCPTGSSNGGKPPLGGTNPNTKHLRKTGINKSIVMKPAKWDNPTQKGETCCVLSITNINHLSLTPCLLSRALNSSTSLLNLSSQIPLNRTSTPMTHLTTSSTSSLTSCRFL